MKRQPRSHLFNFIKKSAAVLLAVEVGVFAGVYHFYHRMNTDRDFRYYMNNNYRFGLEVFYSVGEFFNEHDQTRHFDQRVWSSQFPLAEVVTMAALKSIYYLGGYSIGGYFLMKLIERDPETLRKELPERHEVDYETASQKRNAAFTSILKKVAEGESPEAAAKKVREEWEKELVQKKTS